MRALLCGDREWSDYRPIRTIVEGLDAESLYESGEHVVIIEGGARGADEMAGIEAGRLRGVELEVYPADWDKWGRSAGPIRNRRMLKEGKPDVVFAFHDDLTTSRGTKDMVYAAKQARVPVFVVSHG